ncbi:MAG: hypothetical protein DCC49_03480 [Acidobacteria bacterium]|nr:MAG: hypothetical protein DCC49_03480 [Acidobacteriota bacterium]
MTGKSFDYLGEKAFFSDRIEEPAPYAWLADDLPLWIDGFPEVFEGKRILEIGASEGLIGALVAERYSPAAYIASDVVPWRMIGIARKGASLDARLSVIAANALSLPHPADTFDLVICNGALCHMPGLDVVVSEIARVLRPGGSYLGREPNFHNPLVARKTLYGPWASPNMVPVYPRQLKEAFQAGGFDVRVSLFWRRFPWVKGKYFAVSQKIAARLTAG